MEEFADALDSIVKELRRTYNVKKAAFETKTPDEQREKRENVMGHIENVIFGVVESAARLSPPSLQIRNHRDWDNTVFTDRELYYTHMKLTEGQSEVDAAMRDVCNLLDVKSWDLGVLPTSKGLVAGRLVLVTNEEETLDCSAHAEGLLVPQNVTEIKSMTSDAKYVLIVEKDAVFQKLLAEGIVAQPAPCILITGKGYPDVNTRLLVQRIWETFGLPMFVLTDSDPHGIEIMCVYRFGSLGMSSESQCLATPAVRWLGLHPKDIAVLGVESSPLTTHDKQKIRKLLSRPYLQSFINIRNEVEILQRLGVKAEIEGMAGFATNFLTDYYIPTQIAGKDYL